MGANCKRGSGFNFEALPIRRTLDRDEREASIRAKEFELANDSHVRLNKIMRLRTAIEEGTYHVAAQALADRLIGRGVRGAGMYSA